MFLFSRFENGPAGFIDLDASMEDLQQLIVCIVRKACRLVPEAKVALNAKRQIDMCKRK